MKLSSVLNGFGVFLVLMLVVFVIFGMNDESVSPIFMIAVSMSTLWTTLVLFALAKLLQKSNE